MIANGKVEEACELCAELTEALVDELLHNPKAYKEYVDLWDLQRKHPVSEANTDLELGASSKKV
jgi:hypothetical protein